LQELLLILTSLKIVVAGAAGTVSPDTVTLIEKLSEKFVNFKSKVGKTK